MNVNKIKTHLFVEALNGTYNETIAIKSKLTNDSNDPIVGETVKFYIDGGYIGENTTDKEGIVILNYQITLNPGPHHIQTEYKGNNIYTNAKSSTSTININKIRTQLSIEGEGNLKVGEVYKIIATLSNDNLIPGEEIVFYLNGIEIGRNITNFQGIALWHYKFVNNGKYIFSVQFSGNNIFVESQMIFHSLLINTSAPQTINDNNNNTNKNRNSLVKNIGTSEKTGMPLIAFILVFFSCLVFSVKKP